MKLLVLLLPILGTLALDQVASNNTCQCPQVKCPAEDAFALCQCINNRELACQKACPGHTPTITACAPSLIPEPTTAPKPISSPTCVCEPMACPQIWPGSCDCANSVALGCYKKCGGPAPVLLPCPILPPIVISELQPQPVTTPSSSHLVPLYPSSKPTAKCTCEQVMCIAQYPESCYCANAAAQRCYHKCGGIKPKLKICPPRVVKTLTTKLLPGKSTPLSIATTKSHTHTTSFAPTKKHNSTSTSTSTPPPPLPTHKICGGGRANQFSCDKGETCIPDPYKPGCGPFCDGLGICVQDELCGGFAGFPCKIPGQECHDDPRDDCDPKFGGADCAGLCIWPHQPAPLPQR